MTATRWTLIAATGLALLAGCSDATRTDSTASQTSVSTVTKPGQVVVREQAPGGPTHVDVSIKSTPGAPPPPPAQAAARPGTPVSVSTPGAGNTPDPADRQLLDALYTSEQSSAAAASQAASSDDAALKSTAQKIAGTQQGDLQAVRSLRSKLFPDAGANDTSTPDSSGPASADALKSTLQGVLSAAQDAQHGSDPELQKLGQQIASTTQQQLALLDTAPPSTPAP